MNTRWPIRFRLAAGAAALAGLVVVLFAVAVYAHMRAELFEEVDLELQSYAAKVAGLSLTEKNIPLPAHTRIVAVGVLTDESAPSADGVLDAGLLTAALDHAQRRPFIWRSEERAWRSLWVEAGAGRYVLAYDLEEVDDVLRELIVVCLVGALTLITLAAAAGWWWSGRVLEPVRALKEAAEEIDAGALHRRVPLPEAEDELRRLGEVLNAMLARIESGFLQSRRFTADASHELRTPLTIMSGELERLLRAEGLPAEFEVRLLRVQEATARLQRLTENLLLLARLDASVPTEPKFGRVDLSSLVREACEDGAILAEARGVLLETEVTEGIWVRADVDGLKRVVLNLLDNATRYNRPTGRVWCRLTTDSDDVLLAVGNTGPGIPENLRAHLFQRFMRGDTARAAGGHGLGLALAYEISRAHGGELRLVENATSDVTEFVLKLKRTKAEPS